MWISRTDSTAAGVVGGGAAWAVRAFTVVVVAAAPAAAPAPAFGFVVVVAAPLAVVVVGAAVVVVVSPRRVCAWSLKSSRALSPTLLSLLQAADPKIATNASSRTVPRRVM